MSLNESPPRLSSSGSYQSLNTQGASISLIQGSDENSTKEPQYQIDFPNQEENVAHVAVDIGGSLAKIVWFTRSAHGQGGRLNFCKFETVHMDQVFTFIKSILNDTDRHLIPTSRLVIKATGGGAHKFKDAFKEKLGITVEREDEMECLISGLNFLVRQIENEVFTYDERRSEPVQFESTKDELFPYLVVNIGSGVSIVKVTSEETYERISGTSLGGGTLWGILSLLTNAKDYDEMLELSKKGDNKNVDMLVGDIYGGDYPKIGLKATTIASSFGKVFKTPAPGRKSKFKEEDIAVSLLYMVSNNIGQIAYLNAQAHGIQRIYFSGFFIRGHPITMNTLSYAINFWSKGKMKALFLRHEGYLGAMGAFLRSPPATAARLGSMQENFSVARKLTLSSLGMIGSLEENPSSFKPFPLLKDRLHYRPDTQELTDPALQTYWIDLVDLNLEKLVELALTWKDPVEGRSEPEGIPAADVESRTASFEQMYREHLRVLRKEPSAFGVLTVRNLLNLREQCLREMGFNDIFDRVKKSDNHAALLGLPTLLDGLDRLPEQERFRAMIDNVLGGNMFDWGSTVVQEMLRRGEMDFNAAKNKVGRPRKFNHVEALEKRLVLGVPYKKAVIFADNSGADIIFGIIPFARYLISRGTNVILAANTYPAVNDITARELIDILRQITDPIISSAFANGKLTVVATGASSPCLDLSRVSEELVQIAADADFVVIEGMGRAIHTNYTVQLSVDTLKIAVVKNAQVAQTLGMALYDGMVLFEQS